MTRATKKFLHSLEKVFLWGIKGLSGLVFAWVLTVTGREFIQFGLFSLVFLLLSLTGAFIYLVKSYRYIGLLFVNIIFIALVFGFGFYIDLAYNR